MKVIYFYNIKSELYIDYIVYTDYNGCPNPICAVCPDPSGWWQGRHRGKEGMFPGNYVEKI